MKKIVICNGFPEKSLDYGLLILQLFEINIPKLIYISTFESQYKNILKVVQPCWC